LKIYRLIILGSFLLSFYLSSYGQTKDWVTINKDRYSIDYPNDWEFNETEQMGTSFILFSPLTSEKDQFRENVNLLIQDLKGFNLDLDKYVEISISQIKTIIKNSKIIESKRVTNQTSNYQKVIYTGEQGNFDLKFEQYYWVVGEKAIVLTFSCEVNQFGAYQSVGEKILNSFRFKK